MSTPYESYVALHAEEGDFFQPPLTIQRPSIEEEWERVRGYFTNNMFYEYYDYLPKIPLPEQAPFPYYVSRLMGRGFQRPSEEELAILKQTFYDEVFDENAYDAGIQLLQQGIPTLEEHIFPVMSEHQANLGFYLPPHGYRVTLSRFGTNGSYRTEDQTDDQQSGITVLSTGAESSQLLLERLVHEMAHIGLSQQLIRAGNFSHDEKESTIDEYVISHFGHLFPDYEGQGGRILNRKKFQNLLDSVIYISMLHGIDVPERPDGDARAIRKLLRDNADNWTSILEGRDNHRITNPLINHILDEHDWH